MNFDFNIQHHIGRRIDKWHHYFAIYDKHFQRFQDEDIRVLEIGVDHGGSLQVWKKYFGHNVKIVGLDINPACAEYAEDQIEIVIGNQADTALLKSLGEFDIVIDDGSHRLADQEASFEALWPATRGVYLIEDCHTQYPALHFNGPNTPVVFQYPWVMVIERAMRIIRGRPSRELRPDEAAL